MIAVRRLVAPSLSRVLQLCGCAGLAFGVCYLGLSVAPVLAVAAPLALLAHLGGGAQWTLSTYGLQRRAPDHIRGRILAGDFGIVTLIITVSNLVAGGLAIVIGASWRDRYVRRVGSADRYGLLGVDATAACRAGRRVGVRACHAAPAAVTGEPRLLQLGHRRAGRALHERPQLLGHAPVVAGGVQLAEQRVQAEVDPLDEDERAWHGGVLRDRAGAVERVAHDAAGVLAATT